MLDPIDFAIVKFTDCVSSDVLSQIESDIGLTRYAKNTTIEKQGDPVIGFYIVRSGLVRLGLSPADGSRFNLSILGNGSTFGETALFLGLPVQFDAHSETDVDLIQIPTDYVKKLMESNLEVFYALNRIANARAHTMLNYIGASISVPLETRVAKFLVAMSQEAKNKESINCRQADLAHALGVSRVSMGKSLKSLEAQELIKLGYGKITIVSLRKLKDSTLVSEAT